jgi:hypothetical protein
MCAHLWVGFPGSFMLNLDLFPGRVAIYTFMLISGFFSAEKPNAKKSIFSMINLFISVFFLFIIGLILFYANTNIHNSIIFKDFILFQGNATKMFGQLYFLT